MTRQALELSCELTELLDLLFAGSFIWQMIAQYGVCNVGI